MSRWGSVERPFYILLLTYRMVQIVPKIVDEAIVDPCYIETVISNQGRRTYGPN